MIELSLLFLAGGISSRFGGDPKMLAKIGNNHESLFELSIIQIKKHIKIKNIHIVVNSDNQIPIMNHVKEIIYKYDLNCRVTCNFQNTIRGRKPWGTADALTSCCKFVKGQFILLNSDDLYGEKTFEIINKNCKSNENYLIGFKLGKTLTNDNKANRAFIGEVNDEVNILTEKLNIEKKYYSEIELNDIYVSVNLLVLQSSVIDSMLKMVDEFKKENELDYEKEALLPDFLNKLITLKELNLKLIKTDSQWNGITYKSDIKHVKNTLYNI